MTLTKHHDGSFTLEQELTNGPGLFRQRYYDYSKSEARRRFRAAYREENNKYLINQPVNNVTRHLLPQ